MKKPSKGMKTIHSVSWSFDYTTSAQRSGDITLILMTCFYQRIAFIFNVSFACDKFIFLFHVVHFYLEYGYQDYTLHSWAHSFDLIIRTHKKGNVDQIVYY